MVRETFAHEYAHRMSCHYFGDRTHRLINRVFRPFNEGLAEAAEILAAPEPRRQAKLQAAAVALRKLLDDHPDATARDEALHILLGKASYDAPAAIILALNRERPKELTAGLRKLADADGEVEVREALDHLRSLADEPTLRRWIARRLESE